MCRPNSPVPPAAMAALLFSMRDQMPKKCVSADGLDDVEVLRDESGTPLVARADRPDRPDLVGPAADGLLDIGVGDVDRVDERLSVDDDGRKPHRQRDAPIRQSSVS